MEFFKPNSKDKKEWQSFAKYSGMTFQMLIIIGLATWTGLYLDQKQNLSQPYWTLTLTITSVIISIVAVIKHFLHKK